MARTPGSPSIVPTRDNGRYQLWQSMRVLGQFTIAELTATCSTGLNNAQRYVKALADAGIVRIARSKQEGRRGGDAVYLLIVNEGPNPPRVRVDGTVFDPNTGLVHKVRK